MSNIVSTTKTEGKSALLTVLAVIGCFAIFLLILFIAYLPNRPEDIPHGSFSPEERKIKLNELRANEQKLATSYGWVDQSKGVVQIPIEEAMRLTVQDLQKK